jgi:ribosome modulation factor
MSTSQQSFMELLAGFPKPDIDTAVKLLDHAKDLRLPPRMIENIATFIDRQRDAANKTERAKQATDASTGAWTNVKEAAKKRDDLVSQAEDIEREREQESAGEDGVAKVAALLDAVAPTAVAYFTDPPVAATLDPNGYLASLPLTTNEKKPSLVGLLEASIEIIKHELHINMIDEINGVLEEFMRRCEAGAVGAKSTLVEATKRKKSTAREILAAVAPVELDILEGNDSPDGEAGFEELLFAHNCWKHWDEKLSTPAKGSAIVKEIEAKRAAAEPDNTSTNGKHPEGELKGLDRAREQGRQACMAGSGEEANPYQKANYRDAWNDGWSSADKEGLSKSNQVPAGAKA